MISNALCILNLQLFQSGLGMAAVCRFCGFLDERCCFSNLFGSGVGKLSFWFRRTSRMLGVTDQIGIASPLEQLVGQLCRGHLLKFFPLSPSESSQDEVGQANAIEHGSRN